MIELFIQAKIFNKLFFIYGAICIILCSILVLYILYHLPIHLKYKLDVYLAKRNRIKNKYDEMVEFLFKHKNVNAYVSNTELILCSSRGQKIKTLSFKSQQEALKHYYTIYEYEMYHLERRVGFGDKGAKNND